MYPNLYYFLKLVFGIEVSGAKLINSFGLLVAFAFLCGAWALTVELRRRESKGLLAYSEAEIWVGKGASLAEILWNTVFGFVIGWKFIGFFWGNATPSEYPQEFIFSSRGNVAAGLLLAALVGGLRWWQGNRTKLAKPEKRTIRIWPHDRVGDIIILAALFGFCGAKFFHNLENWNELIKDPVGALLSFSGFTFYGGLICAGATILWYAKKHKIDKWHLVDAFGPALMLAYAVGRLGCQISGDGDWGINNSAYISGPDGTAVLAKSGEYEETVSQNIAYYKSTFAEVNEINTYQDVKHKAVVAAKWLPTWLFAYSFPHNVINEGVPLTNCEGQWCNQLPIPVFPTSFYETLMCLLLFGVLWILRKKINTPGVLFGVYLILNGLERFLIESIRVNTTYHIGSLHPTQAQLISLALVIAGILTIVNRKMSKATV